LRICVVLWGETNPQEDRQREAMPMPIQPVLEFLSRDVLRNIVLLKMLTLFPDAVECHYCADHTGAGVVLYLPTQAVPFDRQAYPSTQYVVLLSATSQNIVRQLLTFVPQGVPLVFKLLDDADRQTVAQLFALRRATAFVSYTTSLNQHFALSSIVRISKQVDQSCFALYAAQGHSREDMSSYFATGSALAFTIYQAATPIATCFIYQNFGDVYEIAGVYTIPSKRRQGYARLLVESALHTLALRQSIPRYQVHEDNQASIQLAEAIGLRRFVTMVHWLAEG
jgi:RimJ/RimL family protein N-acetyltransferase